MTTRREFIASMAIPLLPATALSAEARIKQLADDLSLALAAAHGGKWSKIDGGDFLLFKKELTR